MTAGGRSCSAMTNRSREISMDRCDARGVSHPTHAPTCPSTSLALTWSSMPSGTSKQSSTLITSNRSFKLCPDIFNNDDTLPLSRTLASSRRVDRQRGFRLTHSRSDRRLDVTVSGLRTAAPLAQWSAASLCLRRRAATDYINAFVTRRSYRLLRANFRSAQTTRQYDSMRSCV